MRRRAEDVESWKPWMDLAEGEESSQVFQVFPSGGNLCTTVNVHDLALGEFPPYLFDCACGGGRAVSLRDSMALGGDDRGWREGGWRGSGALIAH